MEITAAGADDARLVDAVRAAFAVVEGVQGRMSAHDPRSEVSRLNREAAAGPVTVSADTFAVLRRAHELAVESRGAFDYTVAPTLARWGFLPEPLAIDDPGGFRHVRLLRGNRVRFLRPLAIDLGGIAKGFAVDAAVDVLRGRGVDAGTVNAGGDLRVFGARPAVVHLRHPSRPQACARSLRLSNAALATSSPCFTETARHGRRVSHLVDPRNGSAVTGGISVSVRAADCWRADALTKVVLNSPALAASLLARHGAEAFVMTA